MRIVVLAEHTAGERRVALTPDAATKLVGDGHTVELESGAGLAAGFDDDTYRAAGAEIADDRAAAIATDGVLVSIIRPDLATLTGLGAGHTVLTLLDPLWRPEPVAGLAATGATALSLELVPRITRAQSMDVLSSMATVAGYQAVLVGASRSPRMFPLLMTAAGTVPAARVLILGAGVAGLQAIATARRLGAVVEAFDIRPAAAEQIRSLGAKSVNLKLGPADSEDSKDPENPEDSGGYAKVQGDDVQARQQAALTPHVAASDLIITTAAIPGARSPLLVTAAMVEAMRPGSLIIDMAAERGGNCEVTVADQEVVHAGVTVLGPTQLESGAARSASLMFATNLVTLLRHLAGDDGALVIDRTDEITAAMLVAVDGGIINDRVAAALGSQAASASGPLPGQASDPAAATPAATPTPDPPSPPADSGAPS